MNNEESWVNVTEGAQLTGYSRFHVQKLARENWAKPEAERFIPVRQHTHGYMLWLPALLKYRDEIGNGPIGKRKINPAAKTQKPRVRYNKGEYPDNRRFSHD